jgi:hypothetical protein
MSRHKTEDDGEEEEEKEDEEEGRFLKLMCWRGSRNAAHR